MEGHSGIGMAGHEKKWRVATDGVRRTERMWGKWKNEGWMILFEMQDKRGISIQGNGLKSRETEYMSRQKRSIEPGETESIGQRGKYPDA